MADRNNDGRRPTRRRIMAAAGAVTIAEVEEVVEPGTLNPDMIHTPGIYVGRVVQGAHYDRRIEKLTVRKRDV